jgi:hypothetical protein
MAKRKKSDVAFDEIAGLVAQAKLSDEVASELTQKMQQFRTGYRQSYLGLLHSARSAALWHAISSALMNRWPRSRRDTDATYGQKAQKNKDHWRAIN